MVRTRPAWRLRTWASARRLLRTSSYGARPLVRCVTGRRKGTEAGSKRDEVVGSHRRVGDASSECMVEVSDSEVIDRGKPSKTITCYRRGSCVNMTLV